MSMLETLHTERQARLARMNGMAFKPPPLRAPTPLPVCVRSPVEAKIIRETVSDERSWNEYICGCDTVEPITTQTTRVGEIKAVVAAYYGVTVAEIESKRRAVNVTRPRQVVMYLSKVLTQRSLPQIGLALGGKDHTTVLHGVRKIAKEIMTSVELADEIQKLTRIIEGRDETNANP